MLETALTMGTILTEQVDGINASTHKLAMTNTNTNINVGAETAHLSMYQRLVKKHPNTGKS